MKVSVRSMHFFIIALVLIAPLSAWPQQESVTGTYDSKNDWFVFEWFNPQTGKQQTIYDSANKVKPTVVVSVTLDAPSGNFTYSYQVTNQAGAVQLLDDFTVKHSAPVFGAVSPSPQDEWYSTEYQGKGAWSWSKIGGSVRGIPAGQTVSGFSFKSKGLPGILDGWCAGERRSKFHFPSPDFDTPEVQASFGRIFHGLKAQYPNKFANVVLFKTVGPVDPPATFNAISFIQNLISLKEQALALNWIFGGTTTSLDAKLNDAQKKIAAGDTKTAKNVMNAYLSELQAQWPKHMNNKAYALLYFNGKYLADHL